MQKCTKCGETKLLSEFYKKQRKCKTCFANYYKENRKKTLDRIRKYNYGISAKEFEKKIIDQNNSCDICHLPFVPHKNPCVDHNHTTGEVRSLLCTHCNAGLGHFKESIEIMKSAQKYIKKYLKKTP
jgi:hypothetical protein